MHLSEDFVTSLRPIYYLSRFVGFSTLITPKFKQASLSVKLVLSVAYQITLMLIVVKSVNDVLLSFYFNNPLPKFERLVLGLQITSVMLTNFMSWYKHILNAKSLIKIINQLGTSSEEIELLGHNIPYNLLIKTELTLIICIAIYACVNFSQNTYMGENSYGIFIMVVCNATLLCEFINCLFLIKYLFHLLNSKLVRYGNASENDFSLSKLKKADRLMFKNVRSDFQPIKKICELHRVLSKLCKEVNQFFALPVLSSILHNILNLTSFCYFVSSFTIDPPSDVNAYLVVSLSTVLGIAIMSLVQLNFLAYICSATSKEASFTGILVHGLLNSDLQPRMRKELMIFSQQILHQKITFTAAGFFVIDFTLINNVIGAVTTYLVILIQFQLST